MKTAIVTGVNGQSGSTLSDILIDKGYKVVGVSRRRSVGGLDNILHLLDNEQFYLEDGDITDSGSINRIVEKHSPDEFYNLAAQSFVMSSWSQPSLTAQVTAIGVLNCLESIRNVKPDTKFYQASSSEIFGKVQEMPQRLSTPHYPRSPYGVSKLFGYWMTINYRESHGLFACNGVLFNHEGPRRGLEFVTRKISDGVAQIALKGGGKIGLGNIDARRDWGLADDYMEAAYLMLQQAVPEDYIIATGEAHSIREFLEIAFKYVGLNYENHIYIDENFIRPAEVDILLGDASKAHEKLGWRPKCTFEELVHKMVEADLQRWKEKLSSGVK